LLLVMLVMLLQWRPLLMQQQLARADATDGLLTPGVYPYTPLELRGRDIYLREGCSGCHTQMVRVLDSDRLRYGNPSSARDIRYDHPVQWGVQRLGPDLAHIGSKSRPGWHRPHLLDPRSLSANSIMPAYPWLLHQRLNYADLPERMRSLRRLGQPYSLTREEFDRNAARFGKQRAQQLDIHRAEASLIDQATHQDYDGNPQRLSELDALIAYLVVLGSGQSASGDAGGLR